ncbi:MAG: hypothetical protein WA742_17635 [Candidatus Cybelea sp.]|jgi:hypothetical protein
MLTKFLARLLGLWIVLTMVSMIATRHSTLAAISGLFKDAPLMWITGVFTLLGGLALVLGHNRWSTALAAIVSFYGWAALAKGLLFLCLPASAQIAFYRVLHFDRFFYAYLLISLVLGGYLIYGGFRPSPRDGAIAKTVP